MPWALILMRPLFWRHPSDDFSKKRPDAFGLLGSFGFGACRLLQRSR